MKNTFRMIGMACMMGALAFVGSSCNKENSETTSMKVNLKPVEEVSIDGDKAYIDYADGRKMKWSEGDQIAFYNLNQEYTQSVRKVYTLYNGAGTTEGDFSGDGMGALNSGFPGYYGFYPASKVVNYPIGPRNSQTFEVPAEQHYNAGTMDPSSLVMAVMGENIMDQGFNMNHIFGFINLKMVGTRKVEWISVTDNALNLSGNITIDIPAVNSSTLSSLVNICSDYSNSWESYMSALNGYLHGEGGLNYYSEPTGKTIKLICDEPVQLQPNTYTNFYITLRPGSLAKGFVVTIKFTDQQYPIEYHKFNPNSPEWAYGAYPQYPRAFCIKPGTAMNAKIN